MAKQTFTTGQVLTAAQMTSLQQTAMGGGSTTAKTASYVLVAADAGTVVQMNSASATTITVNTALFAAGDTVQIQNVGAGVCTVTAGTATVSTSAVLALKQYDAGSLYFNSTSAALFFAADAADGASPLTTKGDLYTYSTADARLAVGTNNYTLIAASGETTGLKWSGVRGVMCQLTASQATVSNTNYTVLFGGEVFDTDAFHSIVTNTGRITIPAGLTGYYIFNMYNRQGSTSSQQNLIALHINGAAIGYGTSNGQLQSAVNTGAIGVSLSSSIVYYATAGDYFTCVAYIGGVASSVDNAYFQAIYLGA